MTALWHIHNFDEKIFTCKPPSGLGVPQNYKFLEHKCCLVYIQGLTWIICDSINFLNKIEYTQIVNTAASASLEYEQIGGGYSIFESMREIFWWEIDHIFCAFTCLPVYLGLDKRVGVWHIGGSVGEVDPIGQVPLLLLLLRSPGLKVKAVERYFGLNYIRSR